MERFNNISSASGYVPPEKAVKAIRRVIEDELGMGWDEFTGASRNARQVEMRTTAVEALFRMSSDAAHHLTEEAAAAALGIARTRLHFHRERYAAFASIYRGYTTAADSLEAAARDYVAP